LEKKYGKKKYLKQGQIIKINFDPSIGSEQAGYRPAIVVSNDAFNKFSNIIWVLPITNKERNFPTHIELSENLVTKGFILCEHLKAVDLSTRSFVEIEMAQEPLIQKIRMILKAIINFEI
jgi:mRNA interferase MazF